MYVVATLTCWLSLLLINTILFINVEKIVLIYTEDRELIDLAVLALRGYMVCSMIEVYMGNLCGCIRGLGKQRTAGNIMSICIFFVSMPMGYILPLSLTWESSVY